MNQIARLQNEPRALELLKARQSTYRRASLVQGAQLVVAVVLPLALAVIGLVCEESRPWVAITALAAVIFDTLVLDRRQRLLLERAAKISEQFDCEILEMDWDSFTAGRKLDRETIVGTARSWRGDEATIRDWYPPVVAVAPVHLARLICQRANLWYDSSLRKRLADGLLIASLVVVVLGLVIGLAMHFDVEAFATTLVAPATPFLAWSIRERYRQSDAASAIETIKSEAEDVWKLAAAGTCGPDETSARSRRFQNAIYGRRVANPLPLPFIYQLIRGEKEVEMNAGAEDMLREAGVNI
ncbi:MAG: S-4TM family putative pore-forming effector [Pseudomonadota bacterium]